MFLVKDDDNTVLLNLVNIVVLENVLKVSFCHPRSRNNHFCQISKVIDILDRLLWLVSACSDKVCVIILQ
jgi:hypothetical protein